MANKHKPKIIWLHSHFLYWMGGTKYIYQVIKEIKDDFDITVIVENAIPLAVENYKKIGVKLISLNKSTSTSPLYWLTLPIHLLQFRNFIMSKVSDDNLNKPLIVSSMFPMNVVAALCNLKHVQYCFEPFAFFHDPEFVRNFPIFKRISIKWAKLMWAWLDVWATKKANKVITLNHTTAKYINEIYGVTPSLSYTGIDTTHFKPFVGSSLSDKYKNKLVILHSTDYTPVKGTDRMLRIFAAVKKIMPTTLLLITSTINNLDGKKRLENLANALGISDSVEFLGFVDYDVLPQLHSLSKVLVQCSYSERSGTTSMALPVKEAMACGTLAIRFPVKGEDVEDGKTGFLVDPRNTSEMVDKIVKILKMPEKSYNEASLVARASIVKKYTWENTANIIKGEIQNVLKNHD